MGAEKSDVPTESVRLIAWTINDPVAGGAMFLGSSVQPILVKVISQEGLKGISLDSPQTWTQRWTVVNNNSARKSFQTKTIIIINK